MDNAKTQARHWLLAAAVALFAAILCLGLVGCGPSEEEKAKQALDAELSQFVNPSDDEASKLVGQMGGSDLKQLEQLGMDGESLFKSWVNGFAYEIGDVKVDGRYRQGNYQDHQQAALRCSYELGRHLC